MASEPSGRLTYGDLVAMFPEEELVRRELVGGELLVTASPARRHQAAVARLVGALLAYAREHGGEVVPGPFDVRVSEQDVLQPDLIFVRADHLDRLEDRFVRAAPDLVVEVSSPSTRTLDLTRKKELYERFGVPEYWCVDLEAGRVEVYRAGARGFDPPSVVGRGGSLRPPHLPGLEVAVDEILGPS